jgi:putative ABC transport system ATP-binding protein
MIRSRDLTFSYPGGAAIAFPDADVPQGAVLLVSGASGCG